MVIFSAGSSFAQITDLIPTLKAFTTDTVVGWKKGVVLFINASQTSLTNWAAGGQNSLSINGLVSVFANYRDEEINWDNSLDVGYGILNQGKGGGFIKTDDKIDFISKYGYKVFKSWYYSALFNFRTQMNKGFNYPNDSVAISKFLAPGYFLVALGIDYKPNDTFSGFISPFTCKVTLVNEQALADSGAFGVDPGKRVRSETGGYVRMIFKKDIVENASFGLKIDLFSNYLKNPENVDINWEMMLTIQFNKLLTATLGTHLIYDDDIKIERDTDKDGVVDQKVSRVQFKELLSIGITFQF